MSHLMESSASSSFAKCPILPGVDRDSSDCNKAMAECILGGVSAAACKDALQKSYGHGSGGSGVHDAVSAGHVAPAVHHHDVMTSGAALSHHHVGTEVHLPLPTAVAVEHSAKEADALHQAAYAAAAAAHAAASAVDKIARRRQAEDSARLPSRPGVMDSSHLSAGIRPLADPHHAPHMMATGRPVAAPMAHAMPLPHGAIFNHIGEPVPHHAAAAAAAPLLAHVGSAHRPSHYAEHPSLAMALDPRAYQAPSATHALHAYPSSAGGYLQHLQDAQRAQQVAAANAGIWVTPERHQPSGPLMFRENGALYEVETFRRIQ